MHTEELRKKLVEEGCSLSNFAIGARESDAHCLVKDGGEWKVVYSERGLDRETLFTSASEEEACAFFLGLMRKQRHWHLVGSFPTEREAVWFEREVARLGAIPIRNDVPASVAGTTRYRVFVAGYDIHLVMPIVRPGI
jgi:hypothetical protein